MSNATDLRELRDQLDAIPKEDVRPPTMPVGIYTQEAEDLLKWVQVDRAALVAAGLDWAVVEDVPRRVGALRETQSSWHANRFAKEEAAKQYALLAPTAYDLRDELIHHMRYAFRNDPQLLGRVSSVADGEGHADMIQDLNDLAVLGRQNFGLLQAIGVDGTLLDEAAQKSDEMAPLLATARGDKRIDSEQRDLRDRAYTFLKVAVDETRACGRYVFWRDDDRLWGYHSPYKRRHRRSTRRRVDDTPSTD